MRKIALMAVVLLCVALLGGCGEDPEQPLIEVVDPGLSMGDTDTTVTFQYQPFTLALGSVTGAVGETVDVPLTVSADAYLVNADVLVHYDPVALRPVVSEDEDLGCAAATDWAGGLWCGEREIGVLQLMLAQAEDGAAEAATVCTLKFEVLTDQPTELMLTVSAAGVCAPNAAPADALGAALLTTENGEVSAPAEE